LPDKFVFASHPSFRHEDRPLRLGILPHDYTGVPEVKARFDAALKVFQQGGCELLDVDYPADFPYNSITGTIVYAEGSAAFAGLIRSERLQLLADTAQQAGLIAGLSISAADYLHALRVRDIARMALNTLWKQCDILIAPTLLTIATPIDQSLNESTEPWGGNGGPGNLAGWPSISVPMGYGKENLPLGLELIGPPLGEQKLLSLAMAYQNETDWHRQHPLI
jgi:aspartyl-tRNA(Asn)/glutamyl-tRNA(Gln) amidotransferase subunit A